MEPKKNPRYNLEDKRPIFFNIGLILSIALVLTAFEWRFYDTSTFVASEDVSETEEELIPITEQPPPEPPKPKTVVTDIIEVTEEEEIEIPDIEIIIDQDEILNFEIPAKVAEPEIEEEITDQPFLIVEEMPEPRGGYAEFYAFVADELRYPRTALNLGIEGKVFVRFVVDEKGNITRLEVVKGIGAGCDEEALRVMKQAPSWKPGKQRGRPVKVQIIVPIVFKLVDRGI